MSTTIPARNKQLAMQAKLSASDDSMRQLLSDWLMGHDAFDAYDADQRAQLVVDLQSLNGLSGMGTGDWHITAAALAKCVADTMRDALVNWLEAAQVTDAYGNDLDQTWQAMGYWDFVADVKYHWYAGVSDAELLDGSQRMVCP